jgi:thiol-disulfide isomerase/thioredoxin
MVFATHPGKIDCMKTKWLIIAILCLAGCGSPEPPRLSTEAPLFVGQSLEGQSISLASLRGKVVVIDFWATWCGPCRRKLPELVEFSAKFAGKPVVLLGISADHKVEELRDFLKKTPLPFPIIFDGSNGPIASQYGVEAYPTLYVVDQEGIIRFMDVHGEKLIQVTEELLATTK